MRPQSADELPHREILDDYPAVGFSQVSCRSLAFDLVPPLAQAVRRPHRAVVVAGFPTGPEGLADRGDGPVVRVPSRPAVPAELGGLFRGRFQGNGPAADDRPGGSLVFRHRWPPSRPAPGRPGPAPPGARTAGRTAR